MVRSMNDKSKLFLLCTVCFFISSLTVFFIPAFPRDSNVTGANILAGIFWIFLIGGIALAVILLKNTKKSTKGLHVFRFFKSKPAIITDTILVISAAAFVLLNVLDVRSEILQEITVFLLLFSIEMHCVLNLLD